MTEKNGGRPTRAAAAPDRSVAPETAGTSRSLSRHFNASQLRADTWNRLKQLAEALEEHHGRRTDAAAHHRAMLEALELLEPIESYWAFPGKTAFAFLKTCFERAEYGQLRRLAARIVRALVSKSYRRHAVPLTTSGDTSGAPNENEPSSEDATSADAGDGLPYFEVLVVDSGTTAVEEAVRHGLHGKRRPEDPFRYEVVVVQSFEDALIAVLFNHNIQAVVIRYGFPFRSNHQLEILKEYLEGVEESAIEAEFGRNRGALLAEMIGKLRPELDCYLVTDASVEEVAGNMPGNLRRVFYQHEDYLELHLNILRGIHERYQTPFFTALKDYASRPTGVFHAMPISRGKSVVKSHWIQDMVQFYGINIFLAETSATSGGLDSLLDPSGPIKKAQELAARAFGARHSFFVTNGTSTANKIVVQAICRPGDIVLVDRNCHKSHHYGLVLSGAHVAYLDSYPLHPYSMYGAVPLREIKRALLRYQRAGLIDRVKMLLLTNCTFDGITYNVEQVIEECLAIKPDLVFLWDEAWFAFARFAPVYRQRTAMEAAQVLRDRYRTAEYREEYANYQERLQELDPHDEDGWLNTRLMPDPHKARVRVYSTQSTHKTLTALRQGSMIHVYDQDFASKAQDAFHEAYMTHTSTSPNYQIIASLDIGRRQVQLEGFELVQQQIEMAMVLRRRVASHPLLSMYFSFLRVKDMIPPAYRESGIENYYDEERGFTGMWDSWGRDEFVLDPTRLTLYIGNTGIDGTRFKTEYLMDKHGIQINKTSRNTVLFMTNIGTTRSSVAYLIDVLVKIAQELEDRVEETSPVMRRLHHEQVTALTEDLPALPDFSRFHERFRTGARAGTPEGDLRAAFFLAYDDRSCEYFSLESDEIDRALVGGRDVVAANFVIPYPPGFPVLVPGQVVSKQILEFLRKIDVKEIHGYKPALGLRVFTAKALERDRDVADTGESARGQGAEHPAMSALKRGT
ncbi:MAG: aminotransferase class I/II-fold pyridoxal phosphate-dependent enzyme [Planctomycetota bacterium]